MKEATTNFRVYKMEQSELASFREHRERAGMTNEVFLSRTMERRLGSLVESLKLLGFKADEEPKFPARLPLSDETLFALRDASEATGLPQSTLLNLVLRLECPSESTGATGTASKAKGRRRTGGTPKAAKKATKKAPKATSGRAGGAKKATEDTKATGRRRRGEAAKAPRAKIKSMTKVAEPTKKRAAKKVAKKRTTRGAAK